MLSRIGLFNRRGIIAALLGFALCALAGHRASAQPDPLPSWSDSAVKQSIIHFVARTTREGADFVPLDQRIAVFDNDGTLWSEQPIYFQVAFAIDRVVKFELGPDGKPELVKQPKVEFVDDGPGKPVGINRFIGRRPIFAFGNSDGDQQMIQWTAAGDGPRFLAILHHTDGEREWAYDRQSHVGRLDKALDEANAKGWTVVDMKRDWGKVFPFE
jgi:hypothetical protein